MLISANLMIEITNIVAMTRMEGQRVLRSERRQCVRATVGTGRTDTPRTVAWEARKAGQAVLLDMALIRIEHGRVDTRWPLNPRMRNLASPRTSPWVSPLIHFKVSSQGGIHPNSRLLRAGLQISRRSKDGNSRILSFVSLLISLPWLREKTKQYYKRLENSREPDDRHDFGEDMREADFGVWTSLNNTLDPNEKAIRSSMHSDYLQSMNEESLKLGMSITCRSSGLNES